MLSPWVRRNPDSLILSLERRHQGPMVRGQSPIRSRQNISLRRYPRARHRLADQQKIDSTIRVLRGEIMGPSHAPESGTWLGFGFRKIALGRPGIHEPGFALADNRASRGGILGIVEITQHDQ